MSVFSIVAARSHSKGLKDKVIQKINDKYIFEYSLDYSLGLSEKIGSEVFTVVSSDSKVIEEFCKKKNTLFSGRKPELATDTAKIEDVIYDTYMRIGRDFEYISLLYGNVPTRYPDEFLKAFNFLEENRDYDAALSMQNVEKYNPAWMFEFNADSLPVKNKEAYRRQDLKKFIIHDGHTILTRSSYFIEYMKEAKAGNIMYEAFGRKIKPMLNNKPVIDIDTQKDLKLAMAALR